MCEACGAEVREASTFCYNCGEAVFGEFSASPPDENDAPMDPYDAEMLKAWKEDDAGVKVAETDTDNHVENSVSTARPRLQSAASLRRRAKVFDRRPAEVVWQSPAAPSKLFITGSIVLVLLAGALLFLALYLK